MTNHGPLMRIHQHPYLIDRMENAVMSLQVVVSHTGVDIEIDIDLPWDNINVQTSGPNYGVALDTALGKLYEILNDRQWPYKPADTNRIRMDSIAADNPSLTRRTT